MRSYRDLPIRGKLQGIIVVTSGVALLVASAGLTIYTRATLLRDKMQELSTAASIIGSNSTAALTFADRKEAAAIIGTLHANANVLAACTYDRRGAVFAKYDRNAPGLDCPVWRPQQDKDENVAGHLAVFKTIRLGGQILGGIFVESDLRDLNRQVARFLGIVLVLLLASITIALLLASLLQRIISGPIRELAATAVSVDKRQDYSIRATKRGNDEVGALFDAFNDMLEHIHMRDRELQSVHNELERRVEERTAYLNTLLEDNKKMEIELRHSQKLEAVGGLAAGIAHEINTPFNLSATILDFSAMLSGKWLRSLQNTRECAKKPPKVRPASSPSMRPKANKKLRLGLPARRNSKGHRTFRRGAQPRGYHRACHEGFFPREPYGHVRRGPEPRAR